MSIKSVVVFRGHAIDTLLTAAPPIEIRAGGATREFEFPVQTPSGSTSVIHPLYFSVEVCLADNDRHRFHFRRGVYVTEPLSYIVTFVAGASEAE